MIFARDCADVLFPVFLAWIWVWAVCRLIGYPAKMEDKTNGTKTFYKVSYTEEAGLSLMGGIWLHIVSDGRGGVFLAAGILCACLLRACIMDMESHLVYNYVWWIGGGAGIVLFCLSPGEQIARIIPGLLVYIVLQEFFFSDLYGRADCHAFCVCALGMAGLGMGLPDYIINILLAFLILGTIQAIYENVGSSGRLKTEVAFLPYIFFSFWVCGMIQRLYTSLYGLAFSV